MRSDNITKGVERMPNRALLHASGVTPDQMRKPFIGVCSSFTDLVPGHIGMRSLERKTEWGVNAGGGVPFLFSVPGICDGIAMGHSGMHYSLPSRELIADMIEQLDEAARPRGEVQVFELPGGISGSALQQALKSMGVETNAVNETPVSRATSESNGETPSR